VNKVDIADDVVLGRLRRAEKHAVFVSARTEEGLADLVAALERDTPRPEVEVSVLLPYTRGDLVSRLHEESELLGSSHTEDGTLLHARVSPSLAAELAEFAVDAVSP
jgi:GTP-binding protein HflX